MPWALTDSCLLPQVDATSQAQWQKLTKLSPADMEALLNLEALGVPIQPKPKLGLTLTRRRNRAHRKVCSLAAALVSAAATARRACSTCQCSPSNNPERRLALCTASGWICNAALDSQYLRQAAAELART